MWDLPKGRAGSVLQDGAESDKLFLEQRGKFGDFELETHKVWTEAGKPQDQEVLGLCVNANDKIKKVKVLWVIRFYLSLLSPQSA